jgi:hypothetical protein
MFSEPTREPDGHGGGFIAHYAAQCFLMWIGAVVLKSIETAVFGWSELSLNSRFGSAVVQVTHPLVLFSVSAGIGFICRRRLSGLTHGASWLWIFPVTCLSAAIVADLFISDFDWSAIWTTYFYWSSPGRDEGPLLRDFLTFPALSCLGYSLGASLERRKRELEPNRVHFPQNQ